MSSTMITIRRPSGNDETVDVTKMFGGHISDQRFARIVADNRKAGRGEVLRWWIERSPAETARLAVYKLESVAEANEDDPAHYIPARMAAEKALREWRATYPAEAAVEREQAQYLAAERRAQNSETIARALKMKD